MADTPAAPETPVAPAAPSDPVADMAALLVETLPHLGHTIQAAELKERITAFFAAQSAPK